MDELEEKLQQLKGYSYQIWDYSVSHSYLTIRGVHPDKSHHNVVITLPLFTTFNSLMAGLEIFIQHQTLNCSKL